MLSSNSVNSGNNSVIENYYANQNNNQILGSIAQSLSFFQSNFYVVINNSNKIVVCNNQFKKTSQISGLTSPRYFLPVSNQKAYVSDLYPNFTWHLVQHTLLEMDNFIVGKRQ